MNARFHTRLLTRGAKNFGKVVSLTTANVHRLGWVPNDDYVELIGDIAYSHHGGKQSVDVYLPKRRDRSSALPFVFFVHGGGWVIGDRKMGALMGRNLARRGIAVVAAGYRLCPSFSMCHQLDDLAEALRFVVRSAPRWGLDPARYVVVGESAGAHLAMRLLQHAPFPTRPSGAVGFYGPYDLELYRRAESPLVRAFLRTVGQGGDLEELCRTHCAIRELPWTDVPVWLVHGGADRFVPVQNSIRLKRLLERQGVPVQLTIYPGSGHGFNYQTRINPHHTVDAYRRLERFFLRAVEAPERAAVASAT